MIMLGTGRSRKNSCEGTPQEIMDHPDPMLQQFIKGEARAHSAAAFQR